MICRLLFLFFIFTCSIPIAQQEIGQLMNTVTSVCDLSYGHKAHMILMKLCKSFVTID